MWQAPLIITAPAAEPISLAQAKQYLRLEEEETGFDAELAMQIAGARGRIESATNTRLVTQTVDICASEFAALERLPIGPVTAIVAITYRDQAGVERSLGPDDIELDGAGLEMGMRPITGTWPVAAAGVTVRAIVGYSVDGTAVPPSIRIALLQQIRELFDGTPADLDTWIVNDRIWL
jgi:uncharacterized phiE125 gp8 family phage protein